MWDLINVIKVTGNGGFPPSQPLIMWILLDCTNLAIKDKFCLSRYRTSRPQVLYKKGALKNFAKFTGKHLCQGLF